MRWSALFCTVVMSLVSANVNKTDTTTTNPVTTPNGDVRPKRDLASIINFKKAIIGKVFGSSAPVENYELYRIPGHDNILVKAVPITPTDSSEPQPEVPSNPTVTLLESYLGTKTSNETLKALDGVKNLLGSGILTNDTLLNRLLVPVQTPQITCRWPQAPLPYPSVFPWVGQSQPFSIVKVPGKPCAYPVGIAPRPSVVEPVKVIPEAPILPPLPFLPQVLVPPRPIIVNEGSSLGIKFPDLPRVVIPDYRPVQVSKIPTNTFIQKGHEHPLFKVPVYGKDLFYPGSYSYQQIHNDGTVTQYFDSKLTKPLRPAVLPPPIVERVELVTEKLVKKKPTYVKAPGNGSVTTFGSAGQMPQLVNVIPGALSGPVLIPKNPAAWGPVHVEKIPKNPSGFSYHQIHGDGSVTLFGDGSIPLARPAALPSIVADRVNIISGKVTDSKPEAFVAIPEGHSGYFYHPNKNDGILIPNNPTAWGPVHVEKISKKPSGFAYHQFHGDGSVTLFGDGSIPLARPVLLPSIVADRINTISEKVTDSKPEIFVGKPEGNSGYSYHQIKNDGSVTTYSGDGKQTEFTQSVPDTTKPTSGTSDIYVTEINTPEFGPVKVQRIEKNPSGFTYHQKNTDGSGTTYTGADVMPLAVEPSIYSTYFNRPDFSHPSYGSVHVEKITEQSRNMYQHPAYPAYSYHLIGDQERISTVAGDNNKIPYFLEPPRLSTLLSRPHFSPEQPNINSVVYVDRIKIPSILTTSTKEGKAPEEPPKLSTMVTNPDIVVTELQQTPHYTEGDRRGFTYHQSHGDGSVTTFTGSDVVHTDSAMPQTGSQVTIGSPMDEGSEQSNSFLSNPNNYASSVPVGQIQQNPSSEFSFQQTNNDGSVNTYSNNGVQVISITPTTEIPAPSSPPKEEELSPGLPKKPCTTPTKCIAENKVMFSTPVVSTYEYTQLVHSNPDKKFTVVNVEDGPVRHQESSVTITPASVSHVSRRPVYRRRTRPMSTELPLAANPIVVPEERTYSYEQSGSDGAATVVEGSNQHVTVSVSGEVRRTIQRGDIPD